MFNQANYAFNIEPFANDQVGKHGIPRDEIISLLMKTVQVPRRAVGVVRPLISVENMYDAAGRLGLNYRHPRGERRVPLVNALANSETVGVLFAGIGSIRYVLARTKLPFGVEITDHHDGSTETVPESYKDTRLNSVVGPGLLDTIRAGDAAVAFTPREISLLDACINGEFRFLLTSTSIDEINELYKKIDVPAYGDQIVACSVTASRFEGRKVDHFVFPENPVWVRTRTVNAPTNSEIMESMIVSGQFAREYDESVYITLDGTHTVLNVTAPMDWEHRAHFGNEVMVYPTTTKCFVNPGEMEWKKIEDAPVDMRCGYKLLKKELDLSEGEVNEIVFKDANRDCDLGLTPHHVIDVFKHCNKTIYIYIMNDGLIAQHIVPVTDRKRGSSAGDRKVAVYISANGHFEEPTDAARERLLNHTPDKSMYSIGDAVEENKKHYKDDAKIYMAENFKDAMAEAKAICDRYEQPHREAALWFRKYESFIESETARINNIKGQKAQREAKKAYKEKKAELKAEVDKHTNTKTEKRNVEYVKIYTPEIDLGPDYDEMVKSGVAYACNRQPCGSVTKINISENVVIFANSEYEQMKKTAAELGFNTYNNETIPALARHAFEEFKKGKNWQSSIFNNEFKELLDMYPCQALNVTFETELVSANTKVEAMKKYVNDKIKMKKDWKNDIFDTEHKVLLDLVGLGRDQVMMMKYEDLLKKMAGRIKRLFKDRVRGVDMFRAYASKAREGGLYIARPDTEIQYYDPDEGITEGAYMYVVETEDTLLFNGNGLYDYILVEYGVREGIITRESIKKRIIMTPVPQNDKILQEFIDDITMKVTNPMHSKKIPNTVIGSMAHSTSVCNPESVILSDLSEAFWYLHNMDKSRKTMSPIGAMKSDPSRTAYHVYGTDKCTKLQSDALIRHVIVQRSRLDAYKLMKRIEAVYPIVSVKTDAVFYKVPNQKDEFPIEKPTSSPPWGSLRREKEREWEQKIAAKKAIKNEEEMINVDTSWREPLGKLSLRTSFDYKRLLDFERVYLAGFPGSGKTWVLNKLYKHYTEVLKKKVIMCAFTHKASRLLCNGVTTHKAFGLNTMGKLNEKAIRHVMENVDVIIIDEISMIPKEIYAVLTQIPKRVRIIGGGDFAQHEPIEDVKRWKTYYDTTMFRSLFNYTQVTLQKDHRSANREANLAFREFFHAAKGSSVKTVFKSIEKFVGIAKADTPYPMKNICFTNKCKRQVNAKVMSSVCKNKIPTLERMYKPFVHEAGKRYRYEHFNARKLYHILTHQDEYKSILSSSSRDATPFEIIQACTKYLMNAKIDSTGMGLIEVEYYRATHGRGRWIASGSVSLSMITRPVRHIISAEIYTDIDVVNAHPVILLFLCQRMGLKTPLLKTYIEEREKIRALIMKDLNVDKEVAKKIILTLINGGEKDYNANKGWECLWLQEFDKEVDYIGNAFKDAFPVLWTQHVIDRRAANDWEGSDMGSFVNKKLLEWEVDIVECALDVMKKHKLLGPKEQDVVYCADGFMVFTCDKLNDALLVEMNEAVFKKYGINVRWEYKAMDSASIAFEPEMPPVSSTGIILNEQFAQCMNGERWDEFPYIDVGMPVIADETNHKFGYNNNQSFTILSRTWHYGDIVTIEDAKDRFTKVLNQMKKVEDEKKAYMNKTIKSLWGASNSRSKDGLVTAWKESVVAKVARCEGRDILLEDRYTDPLTDKEVVCVIAVTRDRFLKDFAPAYCITSHKAQGDTIEGVYGVHELDKNTANGAYVCLTRATDPKNIMVFKSQKELAQDVKNASWLSYLAALPAE